jgi:hypothetical protein
MVRVVEHFVGQESVVVIEVLFGNRSAAHWEPPHDRNPDLHRKLKDPSPVRGQRSGLRMLISYRTITVSRRPSIAIEDVARTGTSFRSQVVGV